MALSCEPGRAASPRGRRAPGRRSWVLLVVCCGFSQPSAWVERACSALPFLHSRHAEFYLRWCCTWLLATIYCLLTSTVIELMGVVAGVDSRKKD